MDILKKTGGSLKYAPSKFQNDKEVVLTAVKNYGLALEYASEELKKDRKVILAALKNNGLALEQIPFHLHDREIKNNGHAYQKQLKYRKDKELTKLALKNGLYITQIDSSLKKDKGFLLEAFKIRDHGNHFYIMDEFDVNEEFLLDLLRETENVSFISTLPLEILTDWNFVMEAIKINPKSFYYNPNMKRNTELAIAALNNGYPMDLFKEDIKSFKHNEETLLYAIKKDETVFKYLGKLRIKRICSKSC